MILNIGNSVNHTHKSASKILLCFTLQLWFWLVTLQVYTIARLW